ncbi:flagellin N-terminal helical domain-containing protein [Phycisphaera mikurensis]|uniref:Flagellin n=1 Tax=Phycisphaera mikurensis (strain NBRC 102666 / KCTC 22515 / FYK2301M01) TaxID=1142394 RepID=I0IBV3_PHYMF|nr:flagellin [Phycisphaera mikurensis]MBB6442032.1 flagellin [Phycisphaera mikurensis]BAM02741.1 flagellin [Phycisphaera mikurensis NBRC 102666]
MSRINTNVSSLLAQRSLGATNRTLNQSLERLSTGLRINRGADDPAGLIASENLRSQKVSITSAIDNAERAEQVVNIAEGGLGEINSLLLEVQSLVGASANEAGISDAEKEANQLEIDSIVQTIDRIASTTSFQGTKLLNGNYGFQTEAVDANVENITVNAAKIPFGESRDVEVLVTGEAQKGGVVLSFGGTEVSGTGGELFTIDVTGTGGSRQFTFASGTGIADISSAINTFSDVTGVTASASGTALNLSSEGFGSDDFVSIDVVNAAGLTGNVARLSGAAVQASDPGTTALADVTSPLRDEGVDVKATINGVNATGKGLEAKISTDFLDVAVELKESGNTVGKNEAATITGGGATFNLGPNVDIGNQVSIGINNVAARNLGRVGSDTLASLSSGSGLNVVDGDLTQAQKVVNAAITEVAGLRGRLGAFQKNTVGSTIRSLGVALENTSAAESSIRDTDFAAETAALTRAQVLQQAATSTLSLANSAPQSVLGLL